MPVILKNLEAFHRGKEGMSDNRVSVMEAGATAGSEHLQERVPSTGWPCQAGTLITPSRDEVTEAPGILANSPNLSLDSGLDWACWLVDEVPGGGPWGFHRDPP